MTHYSIQPRDRIFVKDYGFLSFAENVGRKIGTKYIQKLLAHATYVFRSASKKAI